MARASFHHYSVVTLCAAIFLLFSSAAFIWYVDPYAVHGRPRIAHLNALKPHAYTHSVAAKARLAAEAKPRLLLLGNSRVDAGFDPDSKVIPPNLRPAFNLATPGAGLESNFDALVSNDALADVRRIILGVDFVDFPAPPAALIGATPPSATHASHSVYTNFKLLSETTFSLSSLVDAIDTIRRQNVPNTSSMTVLGHNTFAEYVQFVSDEGYWSIFHQKNLENARSYLRKSQYLIVDRELRTPSLFALQRIIDWSLKKRIRLDLVIYPYHAHILELFDMTELWPLFEQWKRLLVTEVDGLDSPLVRLWDFSGYSQIATEHVPPKGDTTTHMKWYWEAGHFKSALGDEILRTVLSATPLETSGIQLTPQSLSKALHEIRTQRASWRESNQADRIYLQQLIKTLRGNQP